MHELFTGLIWALARLCTVEVHCTECAHLSEVQHTEMCTLCAVRTGEVGACKHWSQHQNHDTFIHKHIH